MAIVVIVLQLKICLFSGNVHNYVGNIITFKIWCIIYRPDSHNLNNKKKATNFPQTGTEFSINDNTN